MRNKQLLTDKENERMFADIVENIVKIPIELRYTSKPIANVESYIGSLKKYHVITLGRIKGVDKFTLLNHESGHILFNSPIKSAEYMIKCWADEWDSQRELIKSTYWYALNLIEDQRIESLMAKLYLNNKRRFYKAKVNVGRGYKGQPNHSLFVLECVRFLCDDLVKHSKYYNEAKRILSAVEGTGQRGALIGLAKFKPFIDEYIRERIEGGFYSTEWSEEVRQTQLGYEERGMVSVNDIEDREKPTYSFDKLFEDSRFDGERDIQYIKNILSNMDINKMDSHDVIEGDNEEHNGVGEPIQEIVDDMSKMFKSINEIPKSTIGYEGDEIDIESYITNKASKIYELDYCFKDTKYMQGASILVSVDGSSSMDDHLSVPHSSMTRARNMVATMYKAIENMNNIDLKTIVWSADLSGKMNVTRINSMEDTRNIRTTVDYPTTPTHMAIEYSTKMMKRMKGRKKLLIFITDGQPEYMKGYTLLPTQTVVKMSINAMVKGMRRCDNMVVLLIKPSDFSRKCCEDIFGKRLIVADDMKSGSNIIMNKFKGLVMGVLS